MGVPALYAVMTSGGRSGGDTFSPCVRRLLHGRTLPLLIAPLRSVDSAASSFCEGPPGPTATTEERDDDMGGSYGAGTGSALKVTLAARAALAGAPDTPAGRQGRVTHD